MEITRDKWLEHWSYSNANWTDTRPYLQLRHLHAKLVRKQRVFYQTHSQVYDGCDFVWTTTTTTTNVIVNNNKNKMLHFLYSLSLLLRHLISYHHHHHHLLIIIRPSWWWWWWHLTIMSHGYKCSILLWSLMNSSSLKILYI